MLGWYVVAHSEEGFRPLIGDIFPQHVGAYQSMLGNASFRPLIGDIFPQPCAWEALILLGSWGRLRGKRENASFCGTLLR